MDRTRTETVALVPVWQIRPRWNAETPQNRAQNVHSEDSIAVIVAKDSDPLFLTNRRQHSIDSLNHPGNRRRLGKIGPGRSLNKRIDVLNPAAYKDVKQWLT